MKKFSHSKRICDPLETLFVHLFAHLIHFISLKAQQLTKAVATLLKLSSEEERLIKETLEWRSSWFGLKPRSKTHINLS